MTTSEQAYRAVEAAIFDQQGGVDCFNPYADINREVDRTDAVCVRRANLRAYFDACLPDPPLFLLAEAPGPWGCRFSGVPITSEAQLVDPAFPIRGTQSSLGAEPRKEYSASIFWGLLKDVFPSFVVWNAYPLHPHRRDDVFSIRPPRQAELTRFLPLVADLISIFQPHKVLAVGRKAEKSLGDAGIAATYVRHPSQGGANAFRQGVTAALGRVQ